MMEEQTELAVVVRHDGGPQVTASPPFGPGNVSPGSSARNPASSWLEPLPITKLVLICTSPFLYPTIRWCFACSGAFLVWVFFGRKKVMRSRAQLKARSAEVRDEADKIQAA